MKQLIVASGNAHKVKEFDGLLEASDFEVFSAKVCGGMPDVLEDGDTFGANARLKALALRAIAPKGGWIVSDDSGLEVDALGGAPGIYSARYAGEGASDLHNLNKLLLELEEKPAAQRAARFRCVLCLIDPSGREQFFDAACEGRIAKAPAGAAGFGYDPIFVPEGHSESFAELDKSIKSKLSHRALAVLAMRRCLES